MDEISFQFEKLPDPKENFTGKTITVVGSNTKVG
jgi:retinol dehydrogenase-12